MPGRSMVIKRTPRLAVRRSSGWCIRRESPHPWQKITGRPSGSPISWYANLRPSCSRIDLTPEDSALVNILDPVNGNQTDWMPARYHVDAVIRWCENRVSLPHSIWFNYSMYSFSAITLQGFIMLYNIKIDYSLRS